MDEDRAAAGGRPRAACRPGDWIDWDDRTDPPLYRVRLWPNRSLGRRGHGVVVGIAALGLMLPLLPALGTPVFWGLLPFEGAALGLLWWGFRRNAAHGRLSEELTLWPDEIRVERREPHGRVRRWRADPFFVRLTLHGEDAPVERYLTLAGGGREIELGAFLSPEERVGLAEELGRALGRTRQAARG